MTTTGAAPPAPPPNRINEQVSAALLLGRQMAELYVAVSDRAADPATVPKPHHRDRRPPPPAAIAGLGPLDDDDAFTLRLLAVQAALHRIASVATDAGFEMPTAGDLVAHAGDLRGDAGCAEVSRLHAGIVEVLSASAPSTGSAYELGTALAGLCEATCKNAAEFEAASNAGRIDRIKSLISRLDSLLPPHAAVAVSGALANWETWLGGHTVKGAPLDWTRDGPLIAGTLNNQGKLWFSLLIGQKSAVDLLSLDDYVNAGEGMVRRYRQLGERFFVQWWPWMAGGLVAVLVLVYLFIHYGNGVVQGFGPLLTILAGVGVTAKTATSTLERTAADVGNSLWEAELDRAVVQAATSLPGVPAAPVAVQRPLQRRRQTAAPAAKTGRN